MFSEKNKILQQVRSLLFYHEQAGLNIYPKTAELDGFLALEESLPENLQIPRATERSTTTVPDVNVPIGEAPVLQQSTIGEIAEEVRKCSSCSLSQGRIVPVPGSGGNNVKLLIVGGWLTTTSSVDVDKSSVFGSAEDLMLSRMLNAIHLRRETAFVTNVIKCGITATVQPKSENVDACVSYLYRQIAATLPDVICTMGIIATRALLQSAKPLSQLRGRFHDCKLGQQTIALMPTYHPSFLLKNPEMKMATWNDLQLIEKRFNN